MTLDYAQAYAAVVKDRIARNALHPALPYERAMMLLSEELNRLNSMICKTCRHLFNAPDSSFPGCALTAVDDDRTAYTYCNTLGGGCRAWEAK